MPVTVCFPNYASDNHMHCLAFTNVMFENPNFRLGFIDIKGQFFRIGKVSFLI